MGMRIEKVKINSYGVLENKEIEFDNNINIIQGSNESGKSTLLSYIVNMFYGISTNKDGKNISDYEKYLPWSDNEFSGKINYTLDNGEKFEVFRDFKKKKFQIYDQNLKDISDRFNIDKKEGSKFFTEQIGIDKSTYLSTVVTMQQGVILDEKNQNILIQKIANLAGTGDDNISYKKANEKLQNKIRDEIGTNKTSQKPINIIENRLDYINKDIERIKPYKDRKYSIEEEKDSVLKQIKELKILEEIAQKEQDVIGEKEKLNDGIENNRKRQENNKEKIIELHKQKKELEDAKNKLNPEIYGKQSKNILAIVAIIVMAILLGVKIFIKNAVVSIVLGASIIGIFIAYCAVMYTRNKKTNELINEKKSIFNDKTNQIAILKGQIDLLENENENLENEMQKIMAEMKNKFDNYNENIIKEYEVKIEKKRIYEIIEDVNINKLVLDIDSKIRDLSINLNKLEVEENTILPQIDKLVNLEEEKENIQGEYKELKYKEKVLNLTIEYLKESYEEMKNTITPKFTQNLSKNIDIISDGKYKNVKINNKNNMIIEKENGEFIEAGQLSIGTIDELYLSLRLSMMDDISSEKLPIILDETFAYFDNNRMKNAIEYLHKIANQHQIIILTCSNRENEAMNKLGIEFENIKI